MTERDFANKNLDIDVLEYEGLSWVNVERPDDSKMDYLKERFPFHPLDLDDCVSRIQLPKLDEYPDYFFLVLHFPLFNKRMRLTVPSQVAIFASSKYLVVVHEGNLRPLVKLFRECASNEAIKSEIMTGSAGMLLYRILDVLVDHCFPIVNKVIGNVDHVEERIFDVGDRDLVRELSLLRRDILAYRRIVRPQIEVLEIMEEKEFTVLGVDPDVYFGDLADHMRSVWAELEDLKEVVEGLHDTHGSLTSHRTNEVIRVLTIIATIMLPLTVLSGMYGMNVVDLPLSDSSAGFWFVLGMMAVVVVVMLTFFRIRRWL